jgi:hypothetical protein
LCEAKNKMLMGARESTHARTHARTRTNRSRSQRRRGIHTQDERRDDGHRYRRCSRNIEGKMIRARCQHRGCCLQHIIMPAALPLCHYDCASVQPQDLPLPGAASRMPPAPLSPLHPLLPAPSSSSSFSSLKTTAGCRSLRGKRGDVGSDWRTRPVQPM